MGKELLEQTAENRIYRDQLITLGDLDHFKTDLLNELVRILQQPQQSQSKAWLKSSEVRKLLSISPGTLQNLRINGTLPFSKIGSIVYYKQEDIFKLLEVSKSK
jgi:hypothetical protein